MPKSEPIDINVLLARAVIGCWINGRPCLLDGENLVIIPVDRLPELKKIISDWLANRPQCRGGIK